MHVGGIRTESLEIVPIYGRLVFLTRAPEQFNGERIVFSSNIAETTGFPHAKE